MTNLFSRVSNELSVETSDNAKVYYDKNILIIKPNIFITNAEHCFSDYHFSIPSTDPPPIKIEKKEYEIKVNRVLTINPEESIIVTKGTENILTKEYTVLFINKKFIQEIAYEICGKTYIKFTNANNAISNKLRFSCELFVDEFKNHQPGHEAMLESISVQIVIELLRELKSNISDKIQEKACSGKQRIDRVIEFIEEYYNSDISLEDLCQVSNLSLYHFIRVFKEETGKTPHEYLIDIKIRKAIEMLRGNQYLINEIAQMCGFISQSHFCSVFKRKVGESASSYRKKL